MSNLEEMTKAELLEYAREREISPANNDMTKAEIVESIQAAEGGGGPDVEEQATTTATKDYLGRALITPTVNSKDYLGRPTLSSVDYLGRLLVL
jgi:hypothetical protein